MFPTPQAPSSFEEWILRLYHFSSNPIESTHDFSPNLVQVFTTFWGITRDFPEESIFDNWGKSSWILALTLHKLMVGCEISILVLDSDIHSVAKYKHLGKPGSNAYNDAVLALARRAKIDALERMINSVKQGWIDLHEEKERTENNKNKHSRK